ncbi:Voltage-dependent calcium channel subunit alpha-2/delta-2 [Portunus trituberculatus]|uniref:Voltage-dependent calcium channel subunit alpha-2/delta-2 n=1 Tax=Portunus trituberculatus TaxID=210409 RepID=A0A5B7DHQ9_PORTR|nr:Voltage-dependent calcium channel subunit alpha-2/delta-2 [Portunus trituberculatus]
MCASLCPELCVRGFIRPASDTFTGKKRSFPITLWLLACIVLYLVITFLYPEPLDPEILNGLQWSAVVDQVFQKNYEKDPTLMWQYFAAQTGFMRVYPATRITSVHDTLHSWYVPPSLVDLDLYDARLRPWYIQGSVSPKDMIILMDRANNYTKSVRIFTYAVGPHPIPTAVLKQMACTTGGMYSVITTRSSIRTKIQKLRQMAIPHAVITFFKMVPNMTSYAAFQESYSSILSPAQPQNGFHTDQYTTTYTSAVNTSSLVGVAGIDVPIKTLKNLSPFEDIGPNGYAFIINNNGFLILHPGLQKQLSYLSAPPHIDLLDVEEDTEIMTLIRDDMITGKSETVQIPGKIRIDDHHHIQHNEIQFSYTPIPNTPYSLGLVNLKNSDHMIVQKPETLKKITLNISLTLVAPWEYCKNQVPGADIDQLMKLQASNDNLIQGLLWSQGWTRQLLQKWQLDHSQDFFSRSIFTRFGLSRFFPNSVKPDVARWRDPWHNPALRRGEVNKGVSVMPHPKGAYISAPVTVKKDKSQVLAGVVGVNFTANALRHHFLEHIKDSEWLNQEDYLLLLLDDGGLIVTANRREFFGVMLQGRFIGDLSIPILNNLKDSGVYKMDIVVDRQALCEQKKLIESSAGLRSHHVPNIFTLIVNFLMEVFSWTEYLRYIIYSGILAVLAPSVDAWTEWGITQIGGLEDCTKERAVYYFGDMHSLSSSMKCTNTSDKIPFWAHRLPNTNALLVAIEMSPNSPECGVFSDLPSIHAQRVEEVESCAYQARFRKRLASQAACNATFMKESWSKEWGTYACSFLLINPRLEKMSEERGS